MVVSPVEDNKKSEEPLKEDDEVNECHAESLL